MDGILEGPAEELDEDGTIIFRGEYKEGVRHSVCADVLSLSVREHLSMTMEAKLKGHSMLKVSCMDKSHITTLDGTVLLRERGRMAS